MHALTIEALAPSAECTQAFAEATCFRHRPWDYASYGSASHHAGKSLGVLRCKRLRCDGPHHFGGARKNAPTSREIAKALAAGPTAGAVPPPAGTAAPAAATDDLEDNFDWTGTHVLPPPVAVILHYESTTYEKWQRKFSDSARHLTEGAEESPGGGAHGRAKKQGYPFQFYCESLGAWRRMIAAQKSGLPGQVTSAEAHCRELWARWKLAPAGLEGPREGEVARVHREAGLTVLAQPAVVGASAGELEASGDGKSGGGGGMEPPTDAEWTVVAIALPRRIVAESARGTAKSRGALAARYSTSTGWRGTRAVRQGTT